MIFPPGVEGCFQFKRSSKLPGSGVQGPRDTAAAPPLEGSKAPGEGVEGLPWQGQGTCISWMLSSSKWTKGEQELWL